MVEAFVALSPTLDLSQQPILLAQAGGVEAVTLSPLVLLTQVGGVDALVALSPLVLLTQASGVVALVALSPLQLSQHPHNYT